MPGLTTRREPSSLAGGGKAHKPSVNRRIFRAAFVIGALTFAVKLVSLVKETTVAACFGTGDALDAFLIAFLLPTVLISGVATNWESVLNAGERFGLTAFAPMMVPLATVAALLAGREALGA